MGGGSEGLGVRGTFQYTLRRQCWTWYSELAKPEARCELKSHHSGFVITCSELYGQFMADRR